MFTRDRKAPTGMLIGGPFLVLIGAAMFADELGYDLPNRWMMLILLLPAGIAIASSVKIMLRETRLQVSAAARAVAGLLFAAIGILLFLHINTGVILPILIMVLGVGATLRVLFVK